jgi:2-(1,2-epoxy-1,2-dihydrophenyl)acetyl-CoA isomerase
MVLDYKLEDGVALITLNRPEVLNALNGEMVEALGEALDQAASDGARAGLLTGKDRAFCSGADLANLGQSMDPTNPIHVRKWVNRMHEVLLKLFEMEIPWVAAVNGPAVGVGANFALACDLLVAAESAYFYWAFTKRGLAVDGGGTWLLPHLVGLHRAKQLALAPQKLSASDAKLMGLVADVVSDGAVMERASALAKQLAQGPTVAYAVTKTSMNRSLSHTFRESLAYEAQGQAVNIRSQDVVEGITAFLEKRDPDFKGE